VTIERLFKRSYESLQELAEFTSNFFVSDQVDRRLLQPVDFAIEELFTNMVKYGAPSDEAVRVSLEKVPGGVEVTLTDYRVDRFDPTEAPEVDISLPLEQRKPGGLGLHLIRRMVDSIGYEYDEDNRESRITFRKTIADRRTTGRKTGG
jgi:anti-sigma regulatory factor (Ser/Thr protein kinase)